MHQTTHLVTIPHPLHPFYVVSILHLRDSLMVWAGETTMAAAEEADRAEEAKSGGAREAAKAPPQGLSEEDARQQAVDEQMDNELAQALAAAGRDNGGAQSQQETTDPASLPKGNLATEWAAAMYRPGAQPLGTSLFRTPSDLALPMSRRLAKRLGISQVHLSLSLPQDLFPAQGNMPAPPGANQALLAIERGIEESIESARAEAATTAE